MLSTRLRPRFGLRAMFLLLAIVAVCLCIVTNAVRRQRNAVRAVLESGGSVQYAHQRQSGSSGDPTPPGPAWLRGIIGDEYFVEVVEVEWVNQGDLEPDDLKWVASFPKLDTVNLNFSSVNDDGLVHLVSAPGLKKIQLEKCGNVTDRGLSYLARLEHVELLSLLATGCTDEGIRTYMPRFSKLTYLDVAGIPITNETAMRLADLPDLKMLHLGRVGHRAIHDLRSAVASLKERLPNCRVNYWGPADVAEERVR